MEEKEKKYRGISFVSGLLGFVFLLALSVTITLNCKPLYRADMKKLQLAQTSGYSEAVILENYDRLIDYNNIWGSDTLEFDGIAMSESGRIHFEDVKRVFAVFQYAGIVAGVLFFIGVIWQICKQEYGWVKQTAYCSLIIPGVLGAVMIGDWENVFVTFHELVFQNDYWLFDPVTDPIIKVLPDAFFMHCAFMIVGIVFLVSLILLAVDRFVLKKQ